MSERFPDEVLQRAWEEGYDLFSHELLNNFDAPDRTVVVAAMRAVLEGHLAAQPVAVTDNLGNTYVRDGNVWRSSDGQITVTLTGAASDGSPR